MIIFLPSSPVFRTQQVARHSESLQSFEPTLQGHSRPWKGAGHIQQGCHFTQRVIMWPLIGPLLLSQAEPQLLKAAFGHDHIYEICRSHAGVSASCTLMYISCLYICWMFKHNYCFCFVFVGVFGSKIHLTLVSYACVIKLNYLDLVVISRACL